MSREADLVEALEKISRHETKCVMPWTHEIAADTYSADLDRLRRIAREALARYRADAEGGNAAQERKQVVDWLRRASESARAHHAEVWRTEDDDVLDAIVERMNNYAFAADQIERGVHADNPGDQEPRP